MAFPRSRILSTQRLAQIIRESNENGQRFCFILGSGASVESGIPTGNTLEMRWMNCLMGEQEDQGTPAMDAEETRRIAEALREEKGIEHPFDVIVEAWQKAKAQGTTLSSEYYFDIYKLRFYSSPRNGYSYMEKLMERCEPSLGYHTLAMLLTETNLNNLVITTNFDSLVEDALFLYTNKKPLVISHESLTDYIEANIQRPIVAKVHRGVLYAPFNSPETTDKLREEWRKALGYAFSNYTPVVIGYAGGDHSLMAYLKEKTTVMRNGVYWCYLGKADDPAALPDSGIQKFVQNKGGYMVAIDGFDALMVEVGKTLYGDAIIPSMTEKHLREKNDRRIQQYNKQWDDLNEKLEKQESLQELNKAEQKEEEKREEKKELTAWDYVRRGLRATEEKQYETAIKEYREAIKKDPKIAAAYNNIGIIYGDSKHYDEAIAELQKAIEMDPSYAKAYYNLGNVYREMQQDDKAIENYKKAIEFNPDYVKAYNNIGIVYVKKGQLEKAAENYTRAIELDPDYEFAYVNRGELYVKMDQPEKAIKEFTRAIELAPDDVQAYVNRGNAFTKVEQYEKAIGDYTKAMELKPESKILYQKRAKAYRAAGKNDLAEKDEETAKNL